jgi:hypothetical protein
MEFLYRDTHVVGYFISDTGPSSSSLICYDSTMTMLAEISGSACTRRMTSRRLPHNLDRSSKRKRRSY